MAGRVTILSFEGIQKKFGPVTVLRGVAFDVNAGEVHALLGENGAGKSTLMRILLGIEHADDGTMRLDGALYRPHDAGEARRAGVVMVPQERTLCPHLSVAENIVLGIEPHGPLGLVRRDEARETAERALAQVTDHVSLEARAGSLSVADQQLVEIARALAQAGGAAKILVLDEPTSSLGKSDAERLFARVRALKAPKEDGPGLAIILVTHFLADVKAEADRYTVLRDGKVQGAGDPRETDAKTIVHEMLGRELETALEELDAEKESDGEEEAPIALEVDGVAGDPLPRAASFVLRRGEILGIAGLVGSGRTELLRAVAGLDPVVRGKVDVKVARGVGLLSEDRGGEGLMLARAIADNVTLSRSGPLFVRPEEARAEGARWIAELAIRASGPEQRTGDLSGGNQQKVQIARLLREDYDVLLVDEPTRGIDVASKAQVLDLFRDLAKKGKAIVLVSSQLDELVTTCDRIAVLRRGELGAAKPAREWDEQSLLLEAAS
ncbi:MAG: sugar ABC transporter ATP-binding protein [Labilithrix sp.]|nr:sugar ABC transporter ATP-binding protein [Labilithrix sp.]